MKHIVIISTSYPLSSDGSEAAGSFVADFAKELSTHIRVTVIAPAMETNNEQINLSLNIQRFKVPTLPLSNLKPHNPLNWLSIIKTLRVGMHSLKELVSNHEVDHIFALWALPSGYWAYKVGKAFNIPYSTWALGSDIWSLGQIPIIKNILKTVLQKSSYNFADGYLLKDTVEEISLKSCYFLPSTRSITVNKQKTLSHDGPYKLAFLGRWHPNKGIDILLDSLSTLSSNDWKNIEEVKICGGGILEKKVTVACNQLKLQGLPIIQHGYLNKKQAIELFLWADYVLIPSRIESIPVVFSDAMKCGCPVVCMPVGDLPKLVNKHKVGILAQSITSESYTLAINKILNFPPIGFQKNIKVATDIFNLSKTIIFFLKIIHNKK